jgi:hypothetical protein
MRGILGGKEKQGSQNMLVQTVNATTKSSMEGYIMVEFRATTIVAVRRDKDDICIEAMVKSPWRNSCHENGSKKSTENIKNSVLVALPVPWPIAFSLREKFEEKLESTR